MAETTPLSAPEIETPSAFERALYIYRYIPWWMVMLGITLLVALGYMFGDADRRDTMAFLADQPKLTTENKFEVTYEVKTDVLIVQQSSLVLDIENRRATVLSEDVVEVIPDGVLTCPANAEADCVNRRGVLLVYRSYDLPPDSTPDGVVAVTGLLVASSGAGGTVQLPDGRAFEAGASQIVAQEDAVLACDRLLQPDCEPISGEIVTVERPYVLVQGIEARGDTIVRFPNGYETVVRSPLVIDKREAILSCDDYPYEPCTPLTVTYATVPDNIVGIETGRDGDDILVRTVDQQTVTLDQARIIEREDTVVTCNQDADPRCQDFEGVTLTLAGEVVTGRLTQETDVHYFIQQEGRSEALRFVRDDIVAENRTPPDCVDRDQDPPCMITFSFAEERLSGRILNESGGEVELELVPERVVRINENDVTDVKRRVPADCALNNPRGCNEGIWLTIIVTLSAYSLALVIGLVFGMFRVSGVTLLVNISTAYVEFVRGVPLAVLLVIFAFVIGPRLRDAEGVVGDVAIEVYAGLDAFERTVFGTESLLAEAVIGLAVGYGAFLAEIFRAGIQSIHKGQIEASRSLGMSYLESMRHVVLPQAIRIILPPLGNDFIAMLKDTSLIAFLALPDLFQRGRADAAASYQVIDVYLGVAVYYVLMTLMLSLLVRFIERRVRLP